MLQENNMSALISIIVPVYNVEHYLPFTLDCILEQTYRNIEIILIDDGSTDLSLSVCRQYAEKDSRIKVIHQENKGVSETRNRGIKLAKGEYVGFVDSDDMPHVGMYSVLYKDMVETNCDLAICDTHFINADTTEISNQIVEERATSLLGNIQSLLPSLLWGKEGRKFYCIWDKLFKKELIDRYHIRFHPELRLGEDTLFTISYLLCCHSISINNNLLYNHRIRQGSLMRSHISGLAEQRLMFVDALEEFAFTISGKNLIAKKIIDYFTNNLISGIFSFSAQSLIDIMENVAVLKGRKDLLKSLFFIKNRQRSVFAKIVYYFPVTIASLLIYLMRFVKRI
jgi:glycosyltransferases involved in cell wall biogenesis